MKVQNTFLFMKKLLRIIKFLVFGILSLPFIVITSLLAQVNVDDISIMAITNMTLSENSVFISPLNSNIVLNSNNHRYWNGYEQTHDWDGVSEHRSNTSGLNWIGHGPVFLNSMADPAVVIDRNGFFYIGYVTDDGSQAIARSMDNGLNWEDFLVSLNFGDIGEGEALDKNHLWVDNSEISPFEGNLYSAWSLINDIGVIIEIRRSRNQGMNWDPIIQISDGVNAGNFNQGVNIQTGPHGEVYVCWAVYDVSLTESAIGFTRSMDGGQNWEIARRIINIAGTRQAPLRGDKTMRNFSFPSMTVNQQNGEIYIVYTEINRMIFPQGDPDIFIIRSDNGGIDWTPRVRVNQDAVIRDQWFPWIACDETSGALVVIYYDSRNNQTMAETFVSISFNRGEDWQDFRISDHAWSGDAIPGAFKNYGGDYIGIDVFHGRAIPVWSSDHTGNMLSYTQPFNIPCPDDLTLCNGFLFNEATYKVTNTITAGGNNCIYNVSDAGRVKMQAGSEIYLLEGFSAEGEFHAYINLTCLAFSEDIIPNISYNTGLENELIKYKKGLNEYQLSSGIDNSEIFVYPNPTSGSFQVTINPKLEKGNEIKQYRDIYKVSERISSKCKTDRNDSSALLLPRIHCSQNPMINNSFLLSSELSSSNKYLIAICDLFGKVLYEKEAIINDDPPFQIEINISTLSKGIYLVKVISKNRTFIETIIYN